MKANQIDSIGLIWTILNQRGFWLFNSPTHNVPLPNYCRIKHQNMTTVLRNQNGQSMLLQVSASRFPAVDDNSSAACGSSFKRISEGRWPKFGVDVISRKCTNDELNCRSRPEREHKNVWKQKKVTWWSGCRTWSNLNEFTLMPKTWVALFT